MTISKIDFLTLGRIEFLAKLGLFETIVIESGHPEMIVQLTKNRVDFIIPSTATNSVDNIMDADYVYWFVDK